MASQDFTFGEGLQYDDHWTGMSPQLAGNEDGGFTPFDDLDPSRYDYSTASHAPSPAPAPEPPSMYRGFDMDVPLTLNASPQRSGSRIHRRNSSKAKAEPYMASPTRARHRYSASIELDVGTVRPRSRTARKLSDHEKRDICRYRDEHPTLKQDDIAERFSVERSTVSKILKQRDRWLPKGTESDVSVSSAPDASPASARTRYPRVDTALYEWASIQDESRLSDEALQDEARRIAASIPQYEQFKASATWLDAWKRRMQFVIPVRHSRTSSELSAGMEPISEEPDAPALLTRHMSLNGRIKGLTPARRLNRSNSLAGGSTGAMRPTHSRGGSRGGSVGSPYALLQNTALQNFPQGTFQQTQGQGQGQGQVQVPVQLQAQNTFQQGQMQTQNTYQQGQVQTQGQFQQTQSQTQVNSPYSSAHSPYSSAQSPYSATPSPYPTQPTYQPGQLHTATPPLQTPHKTGHKTVPARPPLTHSFSSSLSHTSFSAFGTPQTEVPHSDTTPTLAHPHPDDIFTIHTHGTPGPMSYSSSDSSSTPVTADFVSPHDHAYTHHTRNSSSMSTHTKDYSYYAPGSPGPFLDTQSASPLLDLRGDGSMGLGLGLHTGQEDHARPSAPLLESTPLLSGSTSETSSVASASPSVALDVDDALRNLTKALNFLSATDKYSKPGEIAAFTAVASRLKEAVQRKHELEQQEKRQLKADPMLSPTSLSNAWSLELYK